MNFGIPLCRTNQGLKSTLFLSSMILKKFNSNIKTASTTASFMNGLKKENSWRITTMSKFASFVDCWSFYFVTFFWQYICAGPAVNKDHFGSFLGHSCNLRSTVDGNSLRFYENLIRYK